MPTKKSRVQHVKPTMKRTMTTEEDGKMKDPKQLAREIAIESSKFFGSLMPEEAKPQEKHSLKESYEDEPDPYKPFKSEPAIEITEKIQNLLARQNSE